MVYFSYSLCDVLCSSLSWLELGPDSIQVFNQCFPIHPTDNLLTQGHLQVSVSGLSDSFRSKEQFAQSKPVVNFS